MVIVVLKNSLPCIFSPTNRLAVKTFLLCRARCGWYLPNEILEMIVSYIHPVWYTAATLNDEHIIGKVEHTPLTDTELCRAVGIIFHFPPHHILIQDKDDNKIAIFMGSGKKIENLAMPRYKYPTFDYCGDRSIWVVVHCIIHRVWFVIGGTHSVELISANHTCILYHPWAIQNHGELILDHKTRLITDHTTRLANVQYIGAYLMNGNKVLIPEIDRFVKN